MATASKRKTDLQRASRRIQVRAKLITLRQRKIAVEQQIKAAREELRGI